MIKQTKISVFGVSLMLSGIDSNRDPNAVGAIKDEILMRPHILKSQISWADEKKENISIYLETVGLEPEATGKDAAEEIFEVAFACLNKLAGNQITIIDVVSIPGDINAQD
jgi:hypothetical protein